MLSVFQILYSRIYLTQDSWNIFNRMDINQIKICLRIIWCKVRVLIDILTPYCKCVYMCEWEKRGLFKNSNTLSVSM